MPRRPNETRQSQFRLEDEYLEVIETLQDIWSRKHGLPLSRADVLRLSLRRSASAEGIPIDEPTSRKSLSDKEKKNLEKKRKRA